MANLRVVLAACVIAVFAGGCQSAPKARAASLNAAAAPPTTLDRIATLEDRRALGDLPQLATNDGDPVVRARALLALGRLQDPATAPTLIVGLSDIAPLPRYEAAFAAGLIGLSWDPVPPEVKIALADKVMAAESQESDPNVRFAQLEALSRLATPSSIDRLVDRLLGTTEDVQARAALLLGVSTRYGGSLSSRAFSALLPLLKKERSAGARYGAAYALAASKNAVARPGLMLCAQDDSSEVRAVCAKGLGDVGTDTDAVSLRRLLDDGDYRVAVEATRALAKLAERCKGSSCAALGALADLMFRAERLEHGDLPGGAQPLLTLAQSGLPAAGKPLLTQLRARVISGAAAASPALKKDIANIDCRLAAAIDRIDGTLRETLNCGGGLIPEARRLALGIAEVSRSPAADAAKRVDDIAPYLRHADPSVKYATLTALAENRHPSAIDRVRSMLLSTDVIVAAAAADTLGKLNDQASVPAILELATKQRGNPDVAEPLATALGALKAAQAEEELLSWLSIPHAFVRSQAAKALTQITGAPVVAERVERAPSESRPPHIPKEITVTLKTEKGDIVMALYPGDAPQTASNFYQLSKRGFFKNLPFHRIVPDFVAQTGDPRGDGTGSPGYSIRCEVNHRAYTRGVVGMALSGKDTGSSQWFITHAPAPHLDGRYTAFGEVVKGQNVVDQLLEGDRILDVRASP